MEGAKNTNKSGRMHFVRLKKSGGIDLKKDRKSARDHFKIVNLAL